MGVALADTSPRGAMQGMNGLNMVGSGHDARRRLYMTGAWNGSRWWKFDFHAHTPASNDYGKGSQQQQFGGRTPKEWLLDYMRAGIDCVAITDHNSGEWIDQLKTALGELASEKASGFRPLHLFPGVEISVHGGIHLLAIFDPDKMTANIDSLLGAVGFGGTKGSSDAVTTKSLAEVVGAIVSYGGIAIPAHVDKSRGLFNELDGTTLEQVLACGDIFAMEVVDSVVPKPQTYISKKLHWTEVLGSDAHRPSVGAGTQYPGSHFTWMKMGEPSIEGLRLALLDGSPLSVLRSDQEKNDPNQHAAMTIESIEVSGAMYVGREHPFILKFNPGLNAVIGGRGTGKSTLVEFLRLALRRDGELSDGLKAEFEKYRKVNVERGDGGLLTGGATIKVSYCKDGASFRVQWSPDGGLDPIQEKTNDGWKRVEGDIRQRFPVRIFSQKQIFQMAKTPRALMQVIDAAPEVDFRAWHLECTEQENRYLSLRAKAREIEAGLSEEPALRGELDDVKRKLAIFEESGQKEILKDLQKRRRQKQAIETWEQSWGGMGGQLRQTVAEAAPGALELSAFDPSDVGDKQLQDQVAKVRSELDGIIKVVEELAEQADSLRGQWKESVEKSIWASAAGKAAAAYETLQQQLANAQAGDISSYGTLVQRRQTIEQRLKEMDDRRKQVAELKKQWEESFQRLTSVRRRLTEMRKEFLGKVLRDNPHVRISVLPYGGQETVEADFRKLVQREDGRFENDIGGPGRGGLLGGIYRADAGEATIEQSLDDLKRCVRSIASGGAMSEAVRDKRFAAHISTLPTEALDRMDIWFPEDSLEVKYSTQGDGKNFRLIEEGSPGQKTAAMLAFLLSYGTEPLILDQPEDDLDNHLIYDLVVTQLRAAKRHRQVIVVTHNANIVVNGDAEMVVAFCARGGQTQIEAEGCLQEDKVRDTICGILEGGRKAFEERYRRIAQESHHV